MIPTSNRTLVMGIVNVTPDSFSDGGDWFDTDTAIAHARDLVADGADILDIGGESTRPGSERPSAAEELRRVIPVVTALADAGVPLSVDTMRAEVAEASVEAGATIINDVSGGLADPRMLSAVADLGVDFIAMHWRGHGSVMNDMAHYDDVVGEVADELSRSVDAALKAGIDPSRLVIDPGFGFAKDGPHNWELLAGLERFQTMGYPVLVGVSRKRFLGELLDGRPAKGRDAATAAITALCAERGIWAVRTHEVRANRDIVEAIARYREVCEQTGRTAPGRDRATIALTGLRGVGHHGVLASERESGQPFVVDARMELAVDTVSDDLASTVDYSVVAKDIVDIVAGPPVDLIETLAGLIADRCLRETRVTAVEVCVHKPQAPVGVEFSDVSVTVNRSK